MSDLTFDRVREANRVRCQKWHADDTDPWLPADWMTALVGELGEAANVMKKLRRIRSGIPGSRDAGEAELKVMLRKEFADTFPYLDLLAAAMDIDLGAAVIEKFDEVSIREGFPDRLGEPDAVTVTFSSFDNDAHEMARFSTGHEIQLGGSGGDGFCYRHQSFECIDSLSTAERTALADR